MESKYIEHFRNEIEDKRFELGWSQDRMAKALDMPLTTYKTLLTGTLAKLDIAVLIEAEKLTGKSVYELIGETNQEYDMLRNFQKLPEHRQRAIKSLMELEYELSASLEETDEVVNTTCYVPTGNMEDGMYFDSANYKTVNIAMYKRLFAESIDCAIEVTSNHLHPAYHMGNVLLIHQAAPRDGDTGVFIHKPTSRLYIRRFRQTDPCKLIPINEVGKIITVDSYDKKDMSQWIKFGRVLGKMR